MMLKHRLPDLRLATRLATNVVCSLKNRDQDQTVPKGAMRSRSIVFLDFIITPDRWLSKPLILSTNVDQK